MARSPGTQLSLSQPRTCARGHPRPLGPRDASPAQKNLPAAPRSGKKVCCSKPNTFGLICYAAKLADTTATVSLPTSDTDGPGVRRRSRGPRRPRPRKLPHASSPSSAGVFRVQPASSLKKKKKKRRENKRRDLHV